MVYCQGGSLYTLLEQPQYGFGFPDGEFLKFIEHIGRFHRLEPFNHLSPTCDFQQCGILTSVGSDESWQPPFKLRNSKTMFGQ